MTTGFEVQAARRGVYPLAWAAFLAGPIAWCVNLEGCYALALHACAAGGRRTLHLSTLACLAAAVVGGLLARALWARLGHGTPSESEAGPGSGARFLSFLGLVSAPFFAMLILSQWLAILMLDP